MSSTNFRRVVWAFYKKHGRHDLPWRQTHDAYKILVSEVMLQQTQVDRAALFYKDFIKKFPTVQKLAATSLAEVLVVWQGLGYNRRAKFLHMAAGEIVRIGMPRDEKSLEALPGVGSYTACAVAAFAYNYDVIVIETNIRTVVIHHFFGDQKGVTDVEIGEVLAQVLPRGRAREWYSALMDYGAYLKRSGISHNARTKRYVKQTKFAGSLREARGVIVKELSQHDAQSASRLLGLLGDARKEQLRVALAALLVEGLVEGKGPRYRLVR